MVHSSETRKGLGEFSIGPTILLSHSKLCCQGSVVKVTRCLKVPTMLMDERQIGVRDYTGPTCILVFLDSQRLLVTQDRLLILLLRQVQLANGFHTTRDFETLQTEDRLTNLPRHAQTPQGHWIPPQQGIHEPPRMLHRRSVQILFRWRLLLFRKRTKGLFGQRQGLEGWLVVAQGPFGLGEIDVNDSREFAAHVVLCRLDPALAGLFDEAFVKVGLSELIPGLADPGVAAGVAAADKVEFVLAGCHVGVCVVDDGAGRCASGRVVGRRLGQLFVVVLFLHVLLDMVVQVGRGRWLEESLHEEEESMRLEM